ncbi:MAG: AsmA family protein [Nitrospiraceae bacterium]
MMKLFLGVVLGLVLLIVLVLALPFLIDLNKYQDQYRPLIEEALGRNISLKDIRLTIWPRLGARVAGFMVMDDPAFSSDPFASLTALEVGIKLMPLFSGKVVVEEITLRDPVITILKNKQGLLNVSTIGPKGPAKPEAPKPEVPVAPSGGPLQALALLSVDRVTIVDGKLTYHDQSTPKPTEYVIDRLEFLLESVHLGDSPSLHLAATLQPFKLPVTLDGSFGPLVETMDLQQFRFDLGVGKVALNIEGRAVGGLLEARLASPLISSSDLPVALPLTKPMQVKDLKASVKAAYPPKEGSPPLELAEVSNLSLAVAMGESVVDVRGSLLGGRASVNGTSARISTADVPIALPLKKPVEIKDLVISAEMKGQDARLSNLSFQLFNGQVKTQAGLTIESPAPPFTGKATVQGLQLGPALEALGNDRVTVSGTAGAALDLRGQGFAAPDLASALAGTARVALRDGRIEGINLMQEVSTLLKVAGISPENLNATLFSTIETDLAVKSGLITVQRMLMDSHDFRATGAGTVGFDQSLNLTLNLNLSEAVSQKIARSTPVVKLALKDGRLALPLKITGTVQAPSYQLDAKALGGKVQEQVKQKVEKKVEEAVEGLIQGTTKPEDLKKQGKELLKDLFGR